MCNTAIALKTSENGLNTLLQVHQEITGRTNQFKNVQKARNHTVFRVFLYPKGLMDFDKIFKI